MERRTSGISKAASIAFALSLALLLSGASGASLTVYWGQNGVETSLADTCASGNFQFVMLSFLINFGNGQTPVLNLARHCEPSAGTCKSLSADINSCQSSGVKVFFSLGGDPRYANYSLASADDAQTVAKYLWNNYLGGQSDSRPRRITGTIWQGPCPLIARHRRRSISVLPRSANIPMIISTRPCRRGCSTTCGFSSIITRSSYEYTNGDATNLVNTWNTWTTSVTTVQAEGLFLGLPASSAAAGSGFIPADTLISDVLPKIKNTKYGGVMLWNKYFDQQTGYSSAIRSSLSPNSSQFASLTYHII